MSKKKRKKDCHIPRGNKRYPWWKYKEYDKEGKIKQVYYIRYLSSGIWKISEDDLPPHAFVRES